MSVSNFTVKWDGDKLIGLINEAAADGLECAAFEIAKKSAKLCPVDTGDLKSSLYITIDRETLSVKIGYKAPHASIQHEKHYKHIIGEWKYLEKPMDANSKIVFDIVSANIKAAIEGKSWRKLSATDRSKYSWDNYQRVAKGDGKRNRKKRRTK